MCRHQDSSLLCPIECIDLKLESGFFLGMKNALEGVKYYDRKGRGLQDFDYDNEVKDELRDFYAAAIQVDSEFNTESALKQRALVLAARVQLHSANHVPNLGGHDDRQRTP